MQLNIPKINKILIYRCGTIGDTIVSIPAMNLLRKKFSNASFILMTAHNSDGKIWADEVLREFNWFDEFVTYSSSDLRKLKKIFSLIKNICFLNPDLVVYLASDKNSALKIWRDRFFFFLSGAKKFVPVYSSKITCWGHLKKADKIYPKEVVRLVENLKKIGIDNETIFFDLPIQGSHVQKVSLLIEEARLNAQDFMIAMCPWSKQQAKRWPIEHYADLGKKIIEEFDASIAIVGGKEEQEAGEYIARSWPKDRWTIFANRLSILETADLLRRCEFYVGNDTGAMHLAATVGTPCVAIFSAKDPPESWHPYGNNHVVLRKSPPCRNCYLTECHDNKLRCLTEICVDEVFEQCKKMLAGPKSKATN